MKYTARVANIARDEAECYICHDTCHATDGPPKIGPPGPSTANFAAIVGPPRLTMAVMDGPPDYLRRHSL